MDSRDSRFQPYPRRRTRQACEPCRRKKAKCTGERPGCSTCARLRQRCFYVADPPTGHAIEGATRPATRATSEIARPPREPPSGSAEAEALSTRMRYLESAFTQVLERLNQTPQPEQPPSARPPSSPSSTYNNTTHEVAASIRATPQHTPSRLADADLLPPWTTVLAAARDYLRYCDSQPIPLFYPDSFLESLADRDPEVLYGVLALARRFSPPLSSQQQEQEAGEKQERECAAYVQAAHRITMARVVEGRVELSTIQTLCLLSLVEFFNGAVDRSYVHVSLATTLAHCARLDHEVNRQDCQPAAEERRRCYWGLVLLQRLLGWPADGWDDGRSSDNNRNEQLPLFPASLSSPPSEAEGADARCPDGLRGHRPPRVWTEAQRLEGILGTVIQLAEVWSLAQDYVRTRGGGLSSASTAPWSSQSKYTRALRRLMDLGRDLPPLHRNRCIRLANVAAEDLRDDSHARAYWAPWFQSHFLYHTAICLLNHPLLMTLQFQGGRGFSEVFLQQTTHLAAYHGSWLLHFVDFFNRRQFTVTDPVFGYCVAVVATIELQHSFSNDRALRHKARYNYDHCLEYLRRLAGVDGGDGGSGGSGPCHWPYIRRLVQKLDALADQMMAYHRQDNSDNNIHINDATLTVNISGFLEILDMAASAGVPGAPLFGGATLPVHATAEDEEEEARQGPTPLSRLPIILSMDPAKATGRVEKETRKETNSSGRLLSPSPMQQQQQQQHIRPPPPEDAMFLPVDQLLGGHLQDVNAWWSGTWGDGAGSWAAGALGRSAWPLDGDETYTY